MKNTIIAALIAVSLFSCTGNFEEINTNPNRTTVGQIVQYGMFEPLLYDGATYCLYYTWFWNNELIQFTAHTGGTTREEHRYIISNDNWQSVWNTYARRAGDAQHMYELSVDNGDPALQAVALTMKVLNMQDLTNIYGDIPYAEAFTATKPDGTITPRFDSQKDVYTQMFAELERANDLYGATPAPVFQKPALDGMYGGDMTRWRKFNNSLYLRLLCRVSGRAEMNAGARIAAMLADPAKYPVFESNADNAVVKYTGTAPYLSEFYNMPRGEFTADGRKLTEQLIKMTVVTDPVSKVQTYVDPRLPVIGMQNTNLVWKGTVAGCTRGEAGTVDAGTSMLNHPVFCRPDAPAFLMDYAEVRFILAEAALKGFIAGGTDAARAHYEAAVTASAEKWSEQGQYSVPPAVINAADIAALLASDLANWDRDEDKEKVIAEQKYLALFWTGMEAYHEYRRTGYPVLTIGAGCAANDFILPARFGYPNTTMATNAAHVQEALNRMGTNDMKTPLWWSRQAIERDK